MTTRFELPEDNKAYIEGFLAGRKDRTEPIDWRDWASVGLDRDDAHKKLRTAYQEMQTLGQLMEQKLRQKDQEIADRDARILDLESQLRAMHIAFRSVNDDLEQGIRIANKRGAYGR